MFIIVHEDNGLEWNDGWCVNGLKFNTLDEAYAVVKEHDLRDAVIAKVEA